MNQNEVVDPGPPPSELAASKGKPSDTVYVDYEYSSSIT